MKKIQAEGLLFPRPSENETALAKLVTDLITNQNEIINRITDEPYKVDRRRRHGRGRRNYSIRKDRGGTVRKGRRSLDSVNY